MAMSRKQRDGLRRLQDRLLSLPQIRNYPDTQHLWLGSYYGPTIGEIKQYLYPEHREAFRWVLRRGAASQQRWEE